MTKTIISFIAVFIAGFFAGELQTNDSWQNAQLQQERLYTQQLTEKIKQNQELVAQNAIFNIKLQQKESELNDEFTKNQELITRTNVITKRFVRLTTLKTDKMQRSNTESVADSDEPISIIQYREWSLGLQKHDAMCVESYNFLLKAIK